MGSGEPIRGMEFMSMYYDHHFQRPHADNAVDTAVYNGQGYENETYSRYYCRSLGFPLCPVKTTLNQVAKHLITDHLVEGVVDSSIIVEQSMLNEPGTSSILFRPHFLEAFGRWFILISGYDKYQGLYFWNVKCIQHDDIESPVEFSSKMELFSTNKAGQNIVWQAPVFGLDASRPQSTLSSLVIREEIMGEFQYTEANDFKLYFCGGDNELFIPGWQIRVSIIMNHCDANGQCENEITSMVPPAEPNILVSRLVDEKESEHFFQAKKHYGIACKGCSWENFQGVRYSCVYCPNYHICTFCMKSGVHSDHIMIRVMNPEQNEQADCFLNGLKHLSLDDSIQG